MISLDYTVVRYDAPEVVYRGGAQPATRGPGGELSVEQIHETPARVDQLRQEESVQVVAPIMPLRLVEPEESDAEPAGPGSTWGVTAVGADTSPYDGGGITVAILDTGIDAAHPAFADVEIEERDFTGEGNGDTHGHGTHCAGTVFGTDIDGLRIGVARNVDRALIGKVLGDQGGSTGSILDAINWALQRGAVVISMSLGIDFPGMVEFLRDRGVADRAATSMALAAYRDNVRAFDTIADLARRLEPLQGGALLVAASGNESRRQARGASPETYVVDAAPPSAAEGIVAVGALGQSPDRALEVASFSNANPDLSAPGVDVISADVGAGLRALSGTSMATPHVAGVAALWAQKLAAEFALNLDLLSANLVGRVAKTGLSLSDVGAGLAYAPQE